MSQPFPFPEQLQQPAYFSRGRETTEHYRTLAAPGDNDRLASQLRVVALLDRGIKRVHVDVDSFLHGGPPNHTSPLVRLDVNVCRVGL